MIKTIFICTLVTCLSDAYADDTLAKIDNDEDLTPSATYIGREAYTQNPYLGMPSLGGTQRVESALLNQSVAQKWFADGTWNVIGEASYVNINGNNNYGYGANIFAQTGQVAGFSFGGLLTVMNPVFSTDINPTNQAYQAQNLPINQQITPQELFAEYKYNNIVQVDAGYIGINNSPWLTYYQNNVMNVVTYQGASVNVHPLSGWLLTALAFSDTQLTSETGFSRQTLYNSTFDYGTATANITNQGSDGTVALGASYTNPGNIFGFRLWAYQFEGYANLFYADSNLKLQANKDLIFNLAAQAATEGGAPDNILYQNGYGMVQSNMVGLQLSMNYDWWGIQLGYNNVWGPNDAYEGGGIVSPYTYQYATDPLYTTSWMQGLIEKSAGSAYKAAMSFSFLDRNLVISPSYAYYNTTQYPVSSEYDLTISYSIPQVKGFTVFAGYGYQTIELPGQSNVYSGQVMLSYLY